MMVVELLDLNLPVDAVLGAVLDGNGKITAVVEAAELAGRDGSVVEGTSSGLLRCRPVLRLEEADCAATDALTFLDGWDAFGGNAELVETGLTTDLLGREISS